jgi:hypothetical protein
MSSQLTNKDYVSILKFYNLPIPKSKSFLKKHAENIMAEKLCKCIKNIDPNNEAKSIGICTKTIFNKKGFTRGQFQCKTKPTIQFRKTNKFTNKSKNKNKTRRNNK